MFGSARYILVFNFCGAINLSSACLIAFEINPITNSRTQTTCMISESACIQKSRVESKVEGKVEGPKMSLKVREKTQSH